MVFWWVIPKHLSHIALPSPSFLFLSLFLSLLFSFPAPPGSILPRWWVPWAAPRPVPACFLSSTLSAATPWPLPPRCRARPWLMPQRSLSPSTSATRPAWAWRQHCWPLEAWRPALWCWTPSPGCQASAPSTRTTPQRPCHCLTTTSPTASCWRSRTWASSVSQRTWGCTGWPMRLPPSTRPWWG